ncbi:MAG: DUF3301 domain-containing protein [Wenzhouxiangella sp.]|nr:DUF3301 domain-containing protein [Wenzhouxiangella sp.]
MGSSGLETPFAAILILAALCLWWMSAVRARDIAREAARSFCQRQGWQLLDQTVAMSAMWPVRADRGMALRRRYRFDFSPDGGTRRSGEVVLDAGRAVQISAQLEDGNRLIE